MKRVVGLPGESVQVRHGDIYIDGRIERKSLAQQHALALLVHDANCEPRLEPRPPRRWRPDTADSAWTTARRDLQPSGVGGSRTGRLADLSSLAPPAGLARKSRDIARHRPVRI